MYSVLVKVPVVAGRYKLPLPYITIPNHRITNNRVTARAEGVQNMHVAVDMGATFNQYAVASGGVATISASNIPPYITYNILIDGDALSGRSVVNILFTASGTLTALSTDSNGDSKYSFDTSSLPAGKLTVKVGGSGTGSSQTMDLKPKEQTGSTQSVSKPSLTTRLKQMFSSYWKR